MTPFCWHGRRLRTLVSELVRQECALDRQNVVLFGPGRGTAISPSDFSAAMQRQFELSVSFPLCVCMQCVCV